MIWFALVCMFVGVILWELVKFVIEERREAKPVQPPIIYPTRESRWERLHRVFLEGGKEEGGDESGGDMFDYRDRMYRDREFKEGRR